MERRRRILQHAHGRRRRQEIPLRGLDSLREPGIAAQPVGQPRQRVGEPLPHRMLRVGGDPPEPGVERGDDALAVDQSEEARDAHPEARVGAHPLAVAREHVVHDLANDLTEGRTVQRLAERLRQGGDRALVPAVTARDLESAGEHRRRRRGARGAGRRGRRPPAA